MMLAAQSPGADMTIVPPPVVRLVATSFTDARPAVPTGTPMAAWDGNTNTFANQVEASYGGVTWHFDNPVTILRASITTQSNRNYQLAMDGRTITVPLGDKAQRIWNFERDDTPIVTNSIYLPSPTGARIRLYEILLMGYE